MRRHTFLQKSNSPATSSSKSYRSVNRLLPRRCEASVKGPHTSPYSAVVSPTAAFMRRISSST